MRYGRPVKLSCFCSVPRLRTLCVTSGSWSLCFGRLATESLKARKRELPVFSRGGGQEATSENEFCTLRCHCAGWKLSEGSSPSFFLFLVPSAYFTRCLLSVSHVPLTWLPCALGCLSVGFVCFSTPLPPICPVHALSLFSPALPSPLSLSSARFSHGVALSILCCCPRTGRRRPPTRRLSMYCSVQFRPWDNSRSHRIPLAFELP